MTPEPSRTALTAATPSWRRPPGRSRRAGVRQYVLLGAGLDSFAYRNSLDVTVFEVDRPATQQWKRRQLEKAGIAIPSNVTFVGVDFETDSPLERLTEHDFDPSRPSFFCWLGVLMYLDRESVRRTLARLPPGAEPVADYLVPEHLRDEAGSAYAAAVAAVAAEQGEPWLSVFEPDEMSLLLKESGFTRVEQFGQRDAIDPSLWQRRDALAPTGSPGSSTPGRLRAPLRTPRRGTWGLTRRCQPRCGRGVRLADFRP